MYVHSVFQTYLPISLEDVAPKAVVWCLASDVAEDLHVLRVM